MPLSSTPEAIGAVSEALRSQIQLRSSVLTTVKRPEVAAVDDVVPKLNLFLYQIEFDPYLKNHSLDEGQPAPLWLILRYLITAYDVGNDSDSVEAHRLLGRGLACLQEMNFLSPTIPALADNPEPLKLSFDSSDVELLSKVMQGSEEKYRLSAAFQVRPVLIAPDVPPSYAPLVLTVGPPGAEGVVVTPSMGPVLKQITPSRFVGGATLEFSGDDINGGIESVFVGTMELPVIAAREGAVQVVVPAVPNISAGYQPACVARRLPSGRQQTSNPLFVSLLPTVATAVHGVLTPDGTNLFGNVTFTGERLGGVDDSIFVAFYRDGVVVLNIETIGTALQNTLIVNVRDPNDATDTTALPPGTYYLILRVNGAQATFTPGGRLDTMNALASVPSTFSPDMAVADTLAASWLAEVTLLLRREVCWLWHQRGASVKQNTDHLPPAMDAVSESLDLLRFAEDKQRFFSTDVTAQYLSERIHFVRETRKNNHGPWSAIQMRLALDDAAQFVLALGLLAHVDPASAAIIGACQNDAQKTAPTLALALRLYDSAGELSAIDNAHSLFRYGILGFLGSADNPGWHQAYEVSPLVANVLIHDDGRVPSELRLVSHQHTIVHLTPALEAAAQTLHASPTTPQFIPLLGDAGTAFGEWAALLSHETDRTLVEVTQPVLPGNARLAALAAWCWLYNADILLPLIENTSGEHSAVSTQWPHTPLHWYAPMHDMQGTKQFPPHALKPPVALPVTDFEMRVTRIKKALGRHGLGLEADILEAARRFRLGAKAIEAIGLASGAMETLDGEQLHALCRTQVRLDLGSLAQAVTPRFKFKELVLPPAQALQLGEIVHAMSSLTRVHYTWGTARAWNDAGLSVLFCGPPGTGKTMAAEAIADELRLPMFRIDLSQVVNKYIGETEKNLKKVFDAAEESDCVIFFDEADALFGKRTSVKDAHDRFANIEISYLLERMERLKGIAILATNRRKDLDEAFLRRLRYLVEFPLPGEEERARLWKYVFPSGVNIDALDLPYLARHFALAGGHIRSIAFNACLQTKHDGGASIDMNQVLPAVKRELDKLNRPNSPESFGKYEKQVKSLFMESQR